jgi:murein L,D-transpeptidase YcbB/YkuD
MSSQSNNEPPVEWVDANLDRDVIKRIQERLFDTPEDVTGIYNIETQKAVEEFQSQNYLKEDGLPGPITLNAMGIDTEAVQRNDQIGFDNMLLNMVAPEFPGDITIDPP